jgi:hypothetical protein
MLRKNVAGQFIHIQGVDATTGGIKSGVTWTMRRCLDGTFAAGGATITEDSTNGWYKVALTQADTNGNDIGYNFTGTGAIPVTINVLATAADPTDGVHFGLTAIPNAVAGAANGLVICGSNAAVTFAAGVIINQSGANTAGLAIAGNGSGAGVSITGGATGNGLTIIGGGTSGDGINVTTTAGHGANIAATGSSKHGILSTGGNAGTSDGIKAVAGTGGVDLRANITGNITGTLATLTTYTGNTPQTGDAYARLGSPANGTIAADIAEVEGETDLIVASTSGLTFTVANQVDANVLSMSSTLRPGIRKNVALTNFEFLMTDSTNHNPVTGKTVTCTRSIDGGAFGAGTLANVTEIGVGIYEVDFGAGDLNGNVITLRATATGSDDTFVTLKTSP